MHPPVRNSSPGRSTSPPGSLASPRSSHPAAAACSVPPSADTSLSPDPLMLSRPPLRQLPPEDVVAVRPPTRLRKQRSHHPTPFTILTHPLRPLHHPRFPHRAWPPPDANAQTMTAPCLYPTLRRDRTAHSSAALRLIRLPVIDRLPPRPAHAKLQPPPRLPPRLQHQRVIRRIRVRLDIRHRPEARTHPLRIHTARAKHVSIRSPPAGRLPRSTETAPSPSNAQY